MRPQAVNARTGKAGTLAPERLVEIAAVCDSEEGLCAITVRDNGLGIPEADQPARIR